MIVLYTQWQTDRKSCRTYVITLMPGFMNSGLLVILESFLD